jgi:hypothetical protein
MRIRSKRTAVAAALAAFLLGLALVATGDAAGAQGAATGPSPPPPDPYRGSVLYTGRGKGIKKVSFRLKGHKLIEARIAFFERCTRRGRGQGRRYRLRQEFEEAFPRHPLRVDGRGRFRVFRWEVGPSSDERELFAGRVTPRSIVGKFARESNGSASESGISDKCHTGPYGEPMRALTFHARRHLPGR